LKKSYIKKKFFFFNLRYKFKKNSETNKKQITMYMKRKFKNDVDN